MAKMSALTAGQSRLENLELLLADPLVPDVIAQRVAEGETLKDIALAWSVPYGRLAQWVRSDDDRWAKYEGALAIWADAAAQECIDIADNADPEEIAHAKLRIETRLKLASKWDRKMYGDKGDAGNGAGGLTIVIQQADGTLKTVGDVEDAEVVVED